MEERKGHGSSQGHKKILPSFHFVRKIIETFCLNVANTEGIKS
jgi:hypothetical protein